MTRRLLLFEHGQADPIQRVLGKVPQRENTTRCLPVRIYRLGTKLIAGFLRRRSSK